MSVLPFRIPLIGVLFAAALMLAGVARADAAQLTNAGSVQVGGPKLALEVAVDGRVFVKPSNPANFRQQWNRESAGSGRFRYRNQAVNACLIVNQIAREEDDLRVGACNSVGLRNQWTRKDIQLGNGASMLVSAHSGLSFVPNLFAFPSDLLKLATVPNASAFGPFAEYVGA